MITKKHEIKIYSLPTCPHCKSLKAFLKEKRIEFEDFNVDEDEEKAQEMVDKTRQYSTPVIDIDGKIVIGFDEEKIEKLLK